MGTITTSWCHQCQTVTSITWLTLSGWGQLSCVWPEDVISETLHWHIAAGGDLIVERFRSLLDIFVFFTRFSASQEDSRDRCATTELIKCRHLCVSFLKGQVHQGIFSLVGHPMVEHFKGTNYQGEIETFFATVKNQARKYTAKMQVWFRIRSLVLFLAL